MTKSLSPDEWEDKGGINLSFKHMIIPVLLVFLFTAGLVLGQDAINNTSAENATIPENITLPENATLPENVTITENVTAPDNATSTGNVTAPDNVTVAENVTEAQSEAAAAPNLQYIWSVSGIEDGQVTMVLNQNGEDLLGQAKYEPEGGEPWNADVIGSASGDKVQLVLTALKGGAMVTTKMTGTFANEAISGNFTQISGGKVSKTGEFSAIWINPDVSSYAPAETKKQVAQQASSTEPVAQTDAATAPAELGDNTIAITSSSFLPSSITVSVGTTVTWVNQDSNSHTVTSTSGAFDSGDVASGGQFKYTFSKAGTYDYYCKLTPSMTGKVIVTGNDQSRFVDVRKYKDQIGPGGDLSGVPPGMGGLGL